MSRLIALRNHPFPLLLYLEWALLGFAILSALIPAPMHDRQWPMPALLSIAGFALMGLRLPMHNLGLKVLYTGVGFALISLGVTLGEPSFRLLPFLYLLLVIRSCLIFDLPGRLIVSGLTFVTFVVGFFYRIYDVVPLPVPLPAPHIFHSPMRHYIFAGPYSPPPVLEHFKSVVLSLTLNSALLFGAALVFVLLLVNALLAERQSREKLALANTQLRQYAVRIEDQAALQERNRIARDIHDSLGHALTAMNIQLETVLELWPTQPERARKFLAEAKNLGSTSLQAVRHSVSALRSDPLHGESLEAAVTALGEEFERTTGITQQCRIELPPVLPAPVATAVYRIVQEGLTNVSKHAVATHVWISLQAGSELHVTLQDNGVGFQVDENTTGFGLQGMRERAVACGGHLQIASTAGTGCRISAYFPLAGLPG